MSGDPTRRALLAGTAAAAAIGGSDDVLAFVRPLPAAAAHPDAALLALREPYERTLAVIAITSAPHDEAEMKFFAIRTANPGLDGRTIRKESGLVIAERHYLRAVRANSAIITQIASVPARTIAGLKFKAKVSERESNTNLELVDSIVDDILKLQEA